MTIHKLTGTGRRILVVDDDLAVRVLLEAVLKKMNFEVELAEDGLAGLEKLASSRPFDLILLDLMMPRVSGYEFVERIMQTPLPTRPHIVVFTTAGKRGIDRIPDSSVCNSILKPFDLDRFLDIIAECLDGRHESLPRRAVASDQK
jgi:two-component system response regulator MprA